jgi:hypothetical protein
MMWKEAVLPSFKDVFYIKLQKLRKFRIIVGIASVFLNAKKNSMLRKVRQGGARIRLTQKIWEWEYIILT